jgi:hypothetical protein
MRLLPAQSDIDTKLERWRSDPELNRGCASLRHEDLPQYKYVARPLNRFLGGPFQPLTTAMGVAYITDIAMHQFVPLTALAIAQRNVKVLVPYPTFSTLSLIMMGGPVAIMKLSRLLQHLVLRDIAAVLLPDAGASLRDALATRAAAFIKQHPNRQPELLQRSFVEFVASIEGEFSGEAQLFMHELRANDREAKAHGKALWGAVESYHASRTDADFEAIIAALARCFPIGRARVSPYELSALLAQDAAKASLIGALVVAQWINLAKRFMEGELGARVEVFGAATLLSVELGFMAATRLCARSSAYESRSRSWSS